MISIKQKIIIFSFIGLIFLTGIFTFIIVNKSKASSNSSSNSITTLSPILQPELNMAGVYIPSWSYYRSGSGKFPPNYNNRVVSIPNLPENIDYITYAFVLFDIDGNLNWGPNVNVFNSDGTTINSNPVETIDFDMIKYIGSSNIKYKFISVGGYNFSVAEPSLWTAVISSKNAITNLANQLVKMCKLYNLNGVDIDWEFPKSSSELDTFINVAGPILKSNNILITLATGVNQSVIDNSYNFSNIDKYFSWYNLMSYDIYGNFPGSTTFGANTDFAYIKSSIQYLINTKKISSSKLALGLASYGRYTRITNYDTTKSALGQPCTIVDPNNICLSETGSNIASYSGYTADCLSGPYTKTVGYLSYYEILDLLDKTNSTPIYDSTTESSYIVLQKNGINMAISFDTPKNITNKTKYALDNNMKGVFLWQLADDDFQNNFPICNTAISTIKNLSVDRRSPEWDINSNRTLYTIATCGASWDNNSFPLNTVNTCSTFGEPSTVGKGTLSCFGMKTCSPVYNTSCQIGSSSNLNYPPTGNFVPFADYISNNCGNVIYPGSQYGSQFYQDYIQTGRVQICDCNGNQTAFKPDCSGASDIGECLSNSIKTTPSKAMICLDNDINKCVLNCQPQPAQNSKALNADGSDYAQTCDLAGNCTPISICSNANTSSGGVPICLNGNPNVNNVYIKDACGNISSIKPIDCKTYCG